jgi:uncharacterized protein YqjF (DUF2071 family)
MLQRWHEISFFHWSCDPSNLITHLPKDLQLDTFDGKAWITLTPFLLKGLRPPLAPKFLSMDFPEMNLRTYVVGKAGPGIWFFSLDAARLSAVVGARTTFGLPYFWADMGVDIRGQENFYFCNRGGRAKARVQILKGERIESQSALDVFLTARFRLYSTFLGRLITAEVSHPPWELNRVQVIRFEENIRRVMGVELPSGDFLSHHSVGVDTKIGPPYPV